MRIIKFILFCVALCLLVSVSYGQGVITFGATRPQDTGVTKGQIKATALSNSNAARFLTVGPTGLFYLSTPSGGGNADSTLFATQYRLDTVAANRIDYGDTSNIVVTKFKNDTAKSTIRSQIPTNNNQLTNGAGYITSSSLTPYLLKSDSTLYTSVTRLNNAIDSAFEAIDDSTLAVRTDLTDALIDTAAAIRGDLSGKLDASDTASLSNRIDLKLNVADTASLSNRINLKLNSSDTASLSNRINQKGTGTVTSVGLVAGSGMQVSGTSPITTSGTYTVSAEVTQSNAITFTNKRNTPRVNTATSYTTSVTMDWASYDGYVITAQSGALLFNSPSGSFTDLETREVVIKSGSAVALTYNAVFRAGTDVALPTTTTLGKWLRMLFQWNATDSKWDLTGKADGY